MAVYVLIHIGADDSQCSGVTNGRCVIDGIRYAGVGALLANSRAALPDVSSDTAAMQALIDSTAFDADGFDASIGAAQEAIGNVSVSSAIDTLALTEDALDMFNRNETQESFEAVEESLEGLNVSSLTGISLITHDNT